MLELLVALLIVVIVFGLIYWAVMLIPLPAPFKTLAQIVMVLVCVIVLLGLLFGWFPTPFPHHPWLRHP